MIFLAFFCTIRKLLFSFVEKHMLLQGFGGYAGCPTATLELEVW